jgi:hypothetical protein
MMNSKKTKKIVQTPVNDDVQLSVDQLLASDNDILLAETFKLLANTEKGKDELDQLMADLQQSEIKKLLAASLIPRLPNSLHLLYVIKSDHKIHIFSPDEEEEEEDEEENQARLRRRLAYCATASGADVPAGDLTIVKIGRTALTDISAWRSGNKVKVQGQLSENKVTVFCELGVAPAVALERLANEWALKSWYRPARIIKILEKGPHRWQIVRNFLVTPIPFTDIASRVLSLEKSLRKWYNVARTGLTSVCVLDIAGVAEVPSAKSNIGPNEYVMTAQCLVDINLDVTLWVGCDYKWADHDAVLADQIHHLQTFMDNDTSKIFCDGDDDDPKKTLVFGE